MTVDWNKKIDLMMLSKKIQELMLKRNEILYNIGLYIFNFYG